MVEKTKYFTECLVKANQKLSQEQHNLMSLWEDLSAVELSAHVLSSLDFQINDGGFESWYNRGFGTEIVDLVDFLSQHKNTRVINKVLGLVRKVFVFLSESKRFETEMALGKGIQMKEYELYLRENIEECNQAYYTLATDFMEAVEKIFEKLRPADTAS
jgi:hypothetical protein